LPEPRTYIDLPYQDNDQAKGLGARWDPDLRSWYVPSGLDLKAFARWLPISPSQNDPLLPILGLPQGCWKCGEPTMAVIACRDGEQLVFAHDRVLQIVASQVAVEDLASVGAGPLRPRFSRTMGRSSWSNGCLACGALLGGFPLYEDFVACVSDPGLQLPVIASARVPINLLYGDCEPEP
jgi:hypothetical protein